MTLSYKYKIQSRENGQKIKTPSIPIEIKGRTSMCVEIVALLDSGADISVIPKDLAELLNLNLNGKQTIANGIGGQVKAVNTILEVSVGKNYEKYKFEIPVQVIMEGKCDVSMLIGRTGFFDKFKITFDNKNQKVVLKRNHDQRY